MLATVKALIPLTRLTSVNAIEALFTTFAHLFKYLSETLSSNPIALFDEFATLLGRNSLQRPHIVRFAAESLSFLMRRIGTKVLPAFFEHIFGDIRNHNEVHYIEGISSLFFETAKSANHALSSKGLHLISRLLNFMSGDSARFRPEAPETVVLENTTVGLLHHCNRDSYSPVMDLYTHLMLSSDSHERNFARRMCFLSCAVRKGTRICDFSVVLRLLKQSFSFPTSDAGAESGARLALVLYTYAPHEVLFVDNTAILDGLLKDGIAFLQFASLLAKQNPTCFIAFVLPTYRKYMNQNWQAEDLLRLASSLVHMQELGIYQNACAAVMNGRLRLSEDFCSALLARIEELSPSLATQAELSMLVRATGAVTNEQDTTAKRLLSLLSRSIAHSAPPADSPDLALLIGSILMQLTTLYIVEDLEVLGKLASLPRLWSSPAFLKGVCHYSFDDQIVHRLSSVIHLLLRNLADPDHLLRLNSLQILQKMHISLEPLCSDMLSICVLIELTELTFDAQRSLASNFRKFNHAFSSLTTTVTREVVVRFCMGMMTTSYAPLWGMCSETLAIAATSEAQLVWDLAYEWFKAGAQGPQESRVAQPFDSRMCTVRQTSVNMFKCPNYSELYNNCEVFRQRLLDPPGATTSYFAKSAHIGDKTSDVNKRLQALRIFHSIPIIAAQHSQQLVPYFLHQIRSLADEEVEKGDIDYEDDISEDQTATTPTELSPKEMLVSSAGLVPIAQAPFNKKERFELFKLFTIFPNPIALCRAADVHDVLLEMLTSRDSRTQVMAFEMLLKYRDQNLMKYKDNLKNLLSETGFREELTSLIQTDAQESTIQNEDRRHVLPIVARILYGRMINRRHAKSQKKGLANTRNIILGAMASLSSADVAEFIVLFVRNFKHLDFINKSSSKYKLNQLGSQIAPSLRKQVGFCSMLEDAAQQLGSKLLPFVEDVLDPLIFCLVHTQALIAQGKDNEVSLKIARNIRHSTFRILDLLFINCRSFLWTPYLDIIFEVFVFPRLDKLPSESSQNPSGLLRLLGNWASATSTSALLIRNGNTDILHQVFACLAEPSIKPPVVTFLLELIESLCEQVKDENNGLDSSVRVALLPAQIDPLMDNLTNLLMNQRASNANSSAYADLLQLEISVMLAISVFASRGPTIHKLLNLLLPLLQKPRKLVAEAVKEDILKIVENLLPRSEDYITNSPDLWKKYHTISPLLAVFSTRSSRVSLCSVLKIFASRDNDLNFVTSCIEELNSFSMKRLDLPDFDRRLAAFSSLNRDVVHSLNAKAWRPLVYTMLFFIGDKEELALRTGASRTLSLFLDVVNAADSESAISYVAILESDLYPAIKKGMRHPTEIIRQEWVTILGDLVRKCSSWPPIKDLVPLLMGDDEANLFNNILHIQQSRRMTALQRMATISWNKRIGANNVAQVLLPLIEHYCLAPDAGSHHLVGETITTIGKLSRSLQFNQFCALLKRYIDLLTSTEVLQTTVVRLIGATVDALVGTFQVSTELVEDYHDADTLGSTEIDAVDCNDESRDVITTEPAEQSELQSTRPSQAKYHEIIFHRFLPVLMKYLNSTDDETVSLRIPLSLTVVKLLATLPDEILSAKLPGVLSHTCNILRSHSQDARDTTRKVLGMISSLLGPKYFSYILSELKSALQHGYQLHVLGFSLHTILIKLEAPYGSLDYCLSQTIDMLIDDIFGETGIEKDAEDYVKKMKEMKANKSYDSFEILASMTTMTHLGDFIWSLKTILAETSTVKVMRKVDEVFRRLTLGIVRNEGSNSRDSLTFCFNVYRHTVEVNARRDQKILSIQEQARQDAKNSFLIDLDARKSFRRDHTADNAHRVVRFALETLRAILHKYQELQTPENLAAFIPLISDSLMSGQEDVHISALRLLSQIIKVDLPALDSGAPVLVEQAVKFVQNSPSTKTELCQAALKFLAAILSARPKVTIKDSMLSYLLLRLTSDLEEPDRQGIIFSVLRSIMSRKLMVPELYDIVDEIAHMMITNQSTEPRKTARAAYYQFLESYPQGRGRLKNQMAMLVKNLEYVHASGRQSVMEVLNSIIMHFDASLLQEFIPMLYIACTLSLINDDDALCREMSANLLVKLLSRADQERLISIISALKSWAHDERPMLQRASLQGFGLLFDTKGSSNDEVRFFMDRFSTVLHAGATQREDEEKHGEISEGAEPDWEILYYGLQTFSKILSKDDHAITFISSRNAKLWSNLMQILLYRHAWIRLASARLMGILFSKKNKPRDEKDSSIVFGKDLILRDADLVRIGRVFLIQLRSPVLSLELSTQILENLRFLLGIFNERGTLLPLRHDTVLDDAQSGSAETCTEWLIKRTAVSLQSDRDVKRESHLFVRRVLIRFLATAIELLSRTTLEQLSLVIAKPLYKYAEITVYSESLEAVKESAIQVLDSLKQKLGALEFATVYNTVRQAQVAVRENRKLKRTIEAVKEPEKRAEKRIKAGIKKKERRAVLAKESNWKKRIGA